MTQGKKAAFLRAFSRLGNVSAAAKAAKVGRKTVYEWRAKDPDFVSSMADAEQEAIDHLELEATKRALIGSDTLLIFLLKAARPQKYRERVDVTVDVRTAIERLTTDPIEQKAALAEVAAILAEGRR